MLTNNFEPILILLSLIYKIIPFPHTLLIIQAIFTGASVYLIHLTIQKILPQLKWNLLFTNLYASSSGILFAVSYDFHPTLLSVLPLSMILYSYFHQNYRLYWFSIFFSLLFRQDIPIFILGLGLHQLFQRQYRLAFATSLTALIAFSVIQFIILPTITTDPGNQYSGITRFGSSNLPLTNPPLLLMTLLTQPHTIFSMLVSPEIKLHNWIYTFGDYLFLPFTSLFAYLTVIPYLFLRFTSQYASSWNPYVQYNANLEPFLVISAALTFLSIKRLLLQTHQVVRYSTIAVAIIIAIIIKVPYLFGFIHKTYTYLQNASHYTYLTEALQQVPPHVPISAQSELVSRLANRNKIYLYPVINDAEFVVLESSLISANWSTDDYPAGIFTPQTFQLIQREKLEQGWSKFYSNHTLTIYQKTSL